MTIHRRTVLAAIGTALVSAGCSTSTADDSVDGDGSNTGSPNGTPPDTPTEGPTDTPTAGPTDTPPATPAKTPTDTPINTPQHPFQNVPCPSFTDTDRTVCSHTRAADTPVYLDASTETFQPVSGNNTVEMITFTLHNDSGGPFTLNPHAWVVKRKTDDGWTHVAPDAHVEPLYELPDGQTYEWKLSRQTHPTPYAKRTLFPMVEVENGLHAFAVDGSLGGLSEDEHETVECIALFDVQRIWADSSETPSE